MRAGLVSLLLVCTAAGPARAQSSQDRALAESLFRDAKGLVKSGDLDQACPKFAESQRLDPQLGTLLHLATCHEQQGKTASAWAEFSEAAERADAKSDPRGDIARERAAALEGQLGRLRIVVSQPAAELDIRVDGARVGGATLASPFPVDPGDHDIAAARAGGERWDQRIAVPPGPGVHEVTVPLLSLSRDGATEEDSGAGMRTAGWIAGGVGVAGLAVMTVFGILAATQSASADDECDGRFCSPAGLEGHDDARTSATVSTIGLTVGVVGLATGIVLLLIASSPSDDEAAYWVEPSLDHRGGMFRAGFRW